MNKFIDTLSARVRRCLWRMKITRRKEILRAIENQTLHPKNPVAHGFGIKCLAEVRAALGLRPDITNLQISRYRVKFTHELERDGLTWREISRVLHLRGPGQAQELAAKASRQPSVNIEALIFEAHCHSCLDALGCPPGRFIGKRLSDWCQSKGVDPHRRELPAPPTDAEISQFIREYEQGKHRLSPADEAAMKKARPKLQRNLERMLSKQSPSDSITKEITTTI